MTGAGPPTGITHARKIHSEDYIHTHTAIISSKISKRKRILKKTFAINYKEVNTNLTKADLGASSVAGRR